MSDRQAPNAGRDDVICPYLASSGDAAPVCVAHGDSVPVSQRYAAAYCTSRRHVECARYAGAQRINAESTAAQANSNEEPDSAASVVPDLREGSGSSRAPRRARMLIALALLSVLGAITIAAFVLLGGGENRAAVLAPAPTRVATPAVPSSAAAALATTGPVQPAHTPAVTPPREPRPTRAPTAPPERTGIPTVTSTPVPVPTSPARPAPAEAPATAEEPADEPATEPGPTAKPADEPGAERAAAFRSGGAGLARADWERIYGEPTSTVGGFGTYGDGAYLVRFIRGRLQHVERRWNPDDPVPLRVARDAVRRFLPGDVDLVERSRIAEDRLLETYRSVALVRRFAGVPEGNRPWIAVEPGTVLVVYRMTDRGVESVVLSVGDLP
jgi:hypothetical protein